MITVDDIGKSVLAYSFKNTFTVFQGEITGVDSFYTLWLKQYKIKVDDKWFSQNFVLLDNDVNRENILFFYQSFLDKRKAQDDMQKWFLAQEAPYRDTEQVKYMRF